MRELAGLRLDPFRREVYRDGRYVALTRKQFAVLEVLVAAEGGVISAEELLERAWDENADTFTNAVRVTVSALRRLGEPWVIATVPGVGYRIDAGPNAEAVGDEHAKDARAERSPQAHPQLRGFLMVAGVLLLAVVWLLLLRYVPVSAIDTPLGFIPGRPHSGIRTDTHHGCHAPGRRRVALVSHRRRTRCRSARRAPRQRGDDPLSARG